MLGVNEDASADEIRHAYHLRVRELHPDRHPEAAASELAALEDRTAVVNEAWAVLEHEQSRRDYDAELRAIRQAEPSRPPAPPPPTVRSSPDPPRPPPEPAPAVQRRRYFIRVAQAAIAEPVLVADVYVPDQGGLPPWQWFWRRGASLLFLAGRAAALLHPVIVAVTAERVHVLEARSGWRGWRAKREVASWPRDEARVHLLRTDMSLRLSLPDGREWEVAPEWDTPEAVEIARLLCPPV